MESVKSVTNNAVTFSRLFDNILAYITRNNSDDDDDLQAVEETIYKILLRVDGNGGSAEELVAVEEIVCNALLVVLAIRDRAGDQNRRRSASCRPSDRDPRLRRSRAGAGDGGRVGDGDRRRGPAGSSTDRPPRRRSDGGKNDDRDLPAEGAVETAAPTVEDSAAVEPDRPYVTPVEKMSKPRRGRPAAWKSVRRAALRLCCVR